MTGSQVLRVCLTSCAATCLVGAIATAQSLPTPAEVVAGYQRNLAYFPRPHLTMHRTLRTSQEMRDWWARHAQDLERALADPNRSPQQRQAAQELLATDREALAESQLEIHRHEDFWSDRASWQLRVPFRDPDGVPPREHTFPLAPLSTASLTDAYRRHWIYTFAPAGEPSLTVWYGIPNPGAPAYARASDQMLQELPSWLELPPLGAIAGPTAFLAHPVDTIFLRPAGTLRVLGYERLGGATTLKVEHQWLAASTEPHRAAGKLAIGDTITAWLDPAQGFLPLRAEWRRHWQFDGKLLNTQHQHVHKVLRTTRIAHNVGGGFYPIEGVIELRGVAPQFEDAPDIDALIAGQPFNPPMLCEQEWVWRVEKVEPAGAGDAAIYQVKFPAETEFYDSEKSLENSAGEALRIGQPAPPWHVTRWLDNRQHKLADYRGKVIVLYFWIAWREPCMAPLAVLEELHKKFKSRGLEVVGIHVGNIEIDELRNAAAKVTFGNALDAGTDQTAGSTLRAYGVRFYPTTMIIDRQGRLAWSSGDEKAKDLAAATARRLGLTFPLPARLSEEEQIVAWNRIYAAMISALVEQYLPAR